MNCHYHTRAPKADSRNRGFPAVFVGKQRRDGNGGDGQVACSRDEPRSLPVQHRLTMRQMMPVMPIIMRPAPAAMKTLTIKKNPLQRQRAPCTCLARHRPFAGHAQVSGSAFPWRGDDSPRTLCMIWSAQGSEATKSPATQT